MSYDDADFLRLTVEGILHDFQGVLALTAALDPLRSRLKLELQNAFIVGKKVGREETNAALSRAANELRDSLQESNTRIQSMLVAEQAKLVSALAQRQRERDIGGHRVELTLDEDHVDVPAGSPAMPTHLQPDEPPTARCDTCGRKSWACVDDVTPCEMSQPDGSRCSGRLRRER